MDSCLENPMRNSKVLIQVGLALYVHFIPQIENSPKALNMLNAMMNNWEENFGEHERMIEWIEI